MVYVIRASTKRFHDVMLLLSYTVPKTILILVERRQSLLVLLRKKRIASGYFHVNRLLGLEKKTNVASKFKHFPSTIVGLVQTGQSDVILTDSRSELALSHSARAMRSILLFPDRERGLMGFRVVGSEYICTPKIYHVMKI